MTQWARVPQQRDFLQEDCKAAELVSFIATPRNRRLTTSATKNDFAVFLGILRSYSSDARISPANSAREQARNFSA